jgi:hypothetical protein
VLDQEFENGEGFGTERNGARVPPETLVGEIKAESPEDNFFLRVHCWTTIADMDRTIEKPETSIPVGMLWLQQFLPLFKRVSRQKLMRNEYHDPATKTTPQQYSGVMTGKSACRYSRPVLKKARLSRQVAHKSQIRRVNSHENSKPHLGCRSSACVCKYNRRRAKHNIQHGPFGRRNQWQLHPQRPWTSHRQLAR